MAATQPADQVSLPDARRARRPADRHPQQPAGEDRRPILAAWNAKEDLLDLLALARTHPNRETIARLLHRFYTRCADPDLLELHRHATTIETWWPEILAFLHTGITNAGSEGTNRVIKPVAREAYGFRNPENQRLRTCATTTRRHRGHLNPA
ncbi:transposase [Actinoplanes sp. NBC_00393]